MIEGETHYVYYYTTDEGREAYECQTCSKGGSVPESRDVELAAEQHHGFPVSRTNKVV